MTASGSSIRVLRAGAEGARFGMLVTSSDGGTPVRGLRVRVRGDALERALVLPVRARARPFSARLLPWEAAGWEHSLAPEGTDAAALGCVLRAARVRGRDPRDADGDEPDPGDRASSVRDARRALFHAVWVEIEGRAGAEGEGTLELEVSPVDATHEVVTERVALSVRADAARVRTAYLAWDGARIDCVEAVRAALDAMARAVAALPAGERVVVAAGVAAERVNLRQGYAVLGAHGLLGDARFRDLARRLRAGGLELFTLQPPGARRRPDEELALTVSHRGRFAPAPIELVMSVGAALSPDASDGAFDGRLREIVGTSGAARGFVALHDWSPSVLDAIREGRVGPTRAEPRTPSRRND